MTTTTETPTAVTFKIFDSETETWVDLTVTTGEVRTVHTGGKTEEGYSHEYWTYSHEGDHVRCDYSSDSRDCDGRHSDSSVVVCPLDRLTAVPAESGEWELPVRLDWQLESSGQRDYTAEAANY